MSEKKRGLFRDKAVDYQRNKWLGKAMLISKFPSSIVFLASCFFVGVALYSITFGQYTRRINVGGETITFPHPIDIFTQQSGYITKVLVDVSDIVKAGDPLYQISVDRSTESGSVSTNRLAAINEQIKQTDRIIETIEKNKEETLKNLRQQIDYYKEVSVQTEEILKDIKEGVDYIRKNTQDYDRYKEQGLINKDQQTNQRALFYSHQGTYQNLQSQHINNMLTLTNLQSEVLIKSSDFDNQISQYQFQREDLVRQTSEAEAENHLIITSPIDGRIESLSVTTGQMVTQGDSLLQLKPLDENSRLFVVLWVPNDAIPYVAKKDLINIRYDAFPSAKFGQYPGIVNSISTIPASVKELANYKSSPINMQNGAVAPYYKAIIDLKDTHIIYDDKGLELVSGMKLQATLFLESRPIYQWMLAPFYDIKKSVTGVVQ